MDISLDRINFTLKEYDYIFDSNYFIVCEDTTLYGENYIDVTNEWIKNDNTKGIIKNAKSIILNNTKYFVNDKNKINHKNSEKKTSQISC